MGSRKLSDLPPAKFSEVVQSRRAKRMETVDNMKPDLRELVHDYGLTVVKAFMDLGVVRASHIRHVVETVLNEFSPTRGSFSAQGPRQIKEAPRDGE